MIGNGTDLPGYKCKMQKVLLGIRFMNDQQLQERPQWALYGTCYWDSVALFHQLLKNVPCGGHGGMNNVERLGLA